jgi:ATP-dependent protease ClpP protease subunit
VPSWDEVLNEVKVEQGLSPFDRVRRKYLRELHELTGRNVIVYYSGWLQKSFLGRQGAVEFGINDSDKNAFMTTVCRLDRSKGLDLVLHTPGGEMAATESLVDYLRAMFGTDIRAIVPQIAMSAGTMIALACKQIVMGLHSSLGPIDPQVAGLPAHGVLEEFDSAVEEIREDPAKIPVWQPIIAQYSPTLIGECQKAIEWGSEMARRWLETGMFEGRGDASSLAERVVKALGEPLLMKAHDRHITADAAEDLGLNVVRLEKDDDLQDAVLSVHHACVVTLSGTSAIKIAENHQGIAFIEQANVRLLGPSVVQE